MSRLLTILALALTILCSFVFSAPVMAAGIGISPQAFNVQQEIQTVTDTGLSLHNTGEDPASYIIYADDYDQLIQIDNTEIRLEPGEGRWVPITISSFPPGEFTTNISVVASEVKEENLPKTGVKVPVSISSQQMGEVGVSNSFWLPILITLLIAFVLFLLSIWRQSKKSRFSKTIDAVQETVASGSIDKTVTHYQKKHPLAMLSGIALAIAMGLLIWSFLAPSTEVDTEQVLQNIQEYHVTVQTPDEANVYTVRSETALSPFATLEQLRDQYKLELAYDPPTELGVFVTMIAGFENGEEGKYWVYEVNDERIPVAADRMQLEENDRLVWKFIVPSEE